MKTFLATTLTVAAAQAIYGQQLCINHGGVTYSLGAVQNDVNLMKCNKEVGWDLTVKSATAAQIQSACGNDACSKFFGPYLAKSNVPACTAANLNDVTVAVSSVNALQQACNFDSYPCMSKSDYLYSFNAMKTNSFSSCFRATGWNFADRTAVPTQDQLNKVCGNPDCRNFFEPNLLKTPPTCMKTTAENNFILTEAYKRVKDACHWGNAPTSAPPVAGNAPCVANNELYTERSFDAFYLTCLNKAADIRVALPVPSDAQLKQMCGTIECQNYFTSYLNGTFPACTNPSAAASNHRFPTASLTRLAETCRAQWQLPSGVIQEPNGTVGGGASVPCVANNVLVTELTFTGSFAECIRTMGFDYRVGMALPTDAQIAATCDNQFCKGYFLGYLRPQPMCGNSVPTNTYRFPTDTLTRIAMACQPKWPELALQNPQTEPCVANNDLYTERSFDAFYLTCLNKIVDIRSGLPLPSDAQLNQMCGTIECQNYFTSYLKGTFAMCANPNITGSNHRFPTATLTRLSNACGAKWQLTNTPSGPAPCNQGNVLAVGQGLENAFTQCKTESGWDFSVMAYSGAPSADQITKACNSAACKSFLDPFAKTQYPACPANYQCDGSHKIDQAVIKKITDTCHFGQNNPVVPVPYASVPAQESTQKREAC